MFDHCARRPTNRFDPIGEFLSVADSRREAHQPDVLWEVDNDLLPDWPTVCVLQIVDFVEHDHGKVAEVTTGIDHVAQHFGRHHHNRCVTVDRVVTRQQANLLGTVNLDEVSVLLVRERLDRCGVECPLAVAEGGFDSVLGNHGLSAPSGDGDDHMMTVIERFDCFLLKPVEREVVSSENLLAIRPHCDAVAEKFGRSGSLRSRAGSAAPTTPAARLGRPTE